MSDLKEIIDKIFAEVSENIFNKIRPLLENQSLYFEAASILKSQDCTFTIDNKYVINGYVNVNSFVEHEKKLVNRFLFINCDLDNLDIVKYIVSNCKNIDLKIALKRAIYSKNINIVNYLINSKNLACTTADNLETY